MVYSKAILVVLTNVILVQCTVAYKQVSMTGNHNVTGEGPKIYKAVNFDLIFPKSFNSSENVISTTPATIPSPTETAAGVVGQPDYRLPQTNQPTYTGAATAAENQEQEPTIFVTPAPIQQATPLAAASSEAGIYDTQRNTKSNKYSTQVLLQNDINMQQQQQEQLNDNSNSEEEQQQNYATGRAVDYHTGYPFGQVITPLIKNAARPVPRKPVTTFSSYPSSSLTSLAAAPLPPPSNVAKIIYPPGRYQQKPASQAEIVKLRGGKGKFIDRFSPSEGVASHAFKTSNGNSHDHHNRAPSYKAFGKTPTSDVNLYVTPANLYAFPPNNVNYPAQTQDIKIASPSGAVNSYSWPASGSLKDSPHNSNNNPYQYNGPVSTAYLPPPNEQDISMDEGNKNNNGDDGDLDSGGGDDSVGVLPASAMDQTNGDNNDDVHGSMNSQGDKLPDENLYDTGKEYPTPPPGWLKEHPESDHYHPLDDHHPKKPDIIFEYDHDVRHQPEPEHDHEDEHYHHSFPSYPIYHHYPEIIYDDNSHHDHPHYLPPTTTTEAPPPEPPPEPRVKKYSYFYIGRKLWYIPLYFTVWFSFYVLWLILKSIARHKVNLPNHYVARRSVNSYNFSKNQQEFINQLTVSIFDKIDKFKRKYAI